WLDAWAGAAWLIHCGHTDDGGYGNAARNRAAQCSAGHHDRTQRLGLHVLSWRRVHDGRIFAELDSNGKPFRGDAVRHRRIAPGIVLSGPDRIRTRHWRFIRLRGGVGRACVFHARASLEARVKKWAALVLLSCLIAACDEDPARKVQIVARPPSP